MKVDLAVEGVNSLKLPDPTRKLLIQHLDHITKIVNLYIMKQIYIILNNN